MWTRRNAGIAFGASISENEVSRVRPASSALGERLHGARYTLTFLPVVGILGKLQITMDYACMHAVPVAWLADRQGSDSSSSPSVRPAST